MTVITTQQLDASLKNDEVAQGLNASSWMAEITGIDGVEIRPCIAILFKLGCQKGDKAPGRNPAAHLIANEFYRLGITENDAWEFLLQWDQNNNPPLGEHDLGRIIFRAYKRSKPYGYYCQNEKLSYTCIGKDSCPWANRARKPNINQSLHASFTKKRWMWILSNNAKLIYLIALPLLEGRKQVGSGGRIYAGHREIASVLGWKYHSSIARYLKELAGYGLISYVSGEPKCSKHKASEIKRTVPVPEIPELYLAKVPSKFKTFWS